MKFTVRAGFVIHDTRLIEIQGVIQPQTNSYYEGQAVDFDEATALDHAHKLESLSKESTAFLEKNFPPIPVSQSQSADTNTQMQSLAQQVSDLTALVSKMAGAVTAAVSPT